MSQDTEPLLLQDDEVTPPPYSEIDTVDRDKKDKLLVGLVLTIVTIFCIYFYYNYSF